MPGRGDDVPRPNPWRVRYADRQAAEAWRHLVSQVRDAMDRAWVEITVGTTVGAVTASTSCEVSCPTPA